MGQSLTLPRLLVGIGIVTAIVAALALPSLLDGDSSSATDAVVIGGQDEARDGARAGRKDSERDRGERDRATRAEGPAATAAPVPEAGVEDDVDEDDPSNGGTDD